MEKEGSVMFGAYRPVVRSGWSGGRTTHERCRKRRSIWIQTASQIANHLTFFAAIGSIVMKMREDKHVMINQMTHDPVYPQGTCM